MKIIYLLFIFGIIYSSTNPDQVVDIYYNVEYALSKDLSRQFTYYPFRLPVIAGDKMDIEIKVPNNAAHDFTLGVFEYHYIPSDKDIFEHKYNYEKDVISTPGSYLEGDATVYYYTFQVTPTDSIPFIYFSVDVTVPNYDYSYIYFRINLSKYKYSNIKELSFLTDYEIDTSIFGDRKIPYEYQIYIRMSSLSEDQMQIQLTTHEAYDKYSAFEVDVCQYNIFPDESQVYYGHGAVNCQPVTNTATEISKYYYDFQTEPNIKYLSIRIINKVSDLNYLFIYIYTEKGMQSYILALIICAPIIIIAAIILFILRRCGIIGGGISQSSIDSVTKI